MRERTDSLRDIFSQNSCLLCIVQTLTKLLSCANLNRNFDTKCAAVSLAITVNFYGSHALIIFPWRTMRFLSHSLKSFRWKLFCTPEYIFPSPINQNFQLARLRRKEVVNIFIPFPETSDAGKMCPPFFVLFYQTLLIQNFDANLQRRRNCYVNEHVGIFVWRKCFLMQILATSRGWNQDFHQQFFMLCFYLALFSNTKRIASEFIAKMLDIREVVIAEHKHKIQCKLWERYEQLLRSCCKWYQAF